MNRRRAARTTALLLSALALVSTACGSSTDTSSGSSTDATSAPATDGTQAPGTTVAPEEDELTRADAEDVIEDFLTAYYAEDDKAMREKSAAWAFRLAVVDDYIASVKPRPEKRPTRTVTAKVDKVSIDGKIATVKGEAVAELDGPPPTSGLDRPAEKVTFTDFQIWINDEQGPLLVDFTAEPDNRYGPLSGRLSDQVAAQTDNVVKAGDLEITMGVNYRTAGLGPQSVLLLMRFKNSGASTYSAKLEGLQSSYRVDGDAASMPLDGARVPPIGPGKDVTGYVRYNKTDTMKDGDPVPSGTLSFSVTDDAANRYPVDMTTPPFPAKFTPA